MNAGGQALDDNAHQSGVAIIMSKEVAPRLDSLDSWRPINDRVITSRFYLRKRKRGRPRETWRTVEREIKDRGLIKVMGRGGDSSEGQNNLEGESVRPNSPLTQTWKLMTTTRHPGNLSINYSNSRVLRFSVNY